MTAPHPWYAPDGLHAVRDDSELPPDLRGETDADGRRAGVWRSAHPDGKTLAEVPYVGGRVEGTVRLFLPDGGPMRTEEWAAGRREGLSVVHLAMGARWEVPFVGGKQHGTVRIVLPDGRVPEEAEFEDDRMHGRAVRRDEQSRVREEETFVRGLLHGTSVAYDETGRVAASRSWFHGVPHGVSQVPGAPDEQWVHGVRVRGGFQWLDAEGNPARPPYLRVLAALAGAALLAAWSPGLTATLLALGVAIVSHEFGHLLAARRMGVPIVEFRAGFGPKIARFAIGPTAVDVRAIPLYGFVRPAQVRPSALPHVAAALRGAPAPDTPVDPAESIESAGEIAGTRQRIVYELGGIAANVVCAFAVRWLVFAPADPLGSVAWVATRAATMVGAAWQAIVSLFVPATYTGGGGGLLAAGHEHVTDLARAADMFVFLSLFLAAFNLLPVPPLDGFRVVASAVTGRVGRERADRALKPVRVAGSVFFGFLLLANLWFIGRDVLTVASK